MLDFVQQLVSGIALGCVYGLIALGFVLVYKATEVVNFAQGDLMMLGGFFAFTFIGMLGLNYWLGFAGAVICHGAVRHAGRARGGAPDPRLSAVFHHHGDDRARIFPALRGRHDLGHRRFQDRDAVQRGRVADRLAGAGLRQALGDRRDRHPLRAAVSVLQPHHARHRDARQFGEHAGRLLHGHSGQARGVDRVGDLVRRSRPPPACCWRRSPSFIPMSVSCWA